MKMFAWAAPYSTIGKLEQLNLTTVGLMALVKEAEEILGLTLKTRQPHPANAICDIPSPTWVGSAPRHIVQLDNIMLALFLITPSVLLTHRICWVEDHSRPTTAKMLLALICIVLNIEDTPISMHYSSTSVLWP